MIVWPKRTLNGVAAAYASDLGITRNLSAPQLIMTLSAAAANALAGDKRPFVSIKEALKTSFFILFISNIFCKKNLTTPQPRAY